MNKRKSIPLNNLKRHQKQNSHVEKIFTRMSENNKRHSSVHFPQEHRSYSCALSASKEQRIHVWGVVHPHMPFQSVSLVLSLTHSSAQLVTNHLQLLRWPTASARKPVSYFHPDDHARDAWLCKKKLHLVHIPGRFTDCCLCCFFSLDNELRRESAKEELRICTPSHPLPLEIQQVELSVLVCIGWSHAGLLGWRCSESRL